MRKKLIKLLKRNNKIVKRNSSAENDEGLELR